MLIACGECHGRGEVIDPLDADGDLVLCPSCGGTKVAAPVRRRYRHIAIDLTRQYAVPDDGCDAQDPWSA